MRVQPTAMRLLSTAAKRPWQLQCRSFHATVRHPDPLRILFCGSDDFSVASLDALDQERLVESAADIESIHVVCRPGKPTGARLKPPAGINLIIAVSFGLFVPPRILNGAKYGGLNVHPSMLPDLRGPAPIHWTILLDRKHTGVTLQTLHPEKIDHGTILAQTAPPGMPYPHEATTKDMIPFMAAKGADLLIEGLKHRVFESSEPITHSEASILKITDGKGIAHAPKIKPEDRHIPSWEDMDAETLLRKHRAMGHLWDKTTWQRWVSDVRKEFPSFKPKSVTPKRVVFSGGFSEYDIKSTGSVVDSSDGSGTRSEMPDLEAQVAKDRAHVQSVLDKNPTPGQLIFLPREKSLPKLLVLSSDRRLLRVNSCTIDGGKKDSGIREMWNQYTKGQNAQIFRRSSSTSLENREAVSEDGEINWK
ncbi:methionyl-tRNA formyltransferase family protein [Venturia nashicola]|uniref:methionyl-tRNA formyltransferase n=1 Tax=Venturia nashicola TaxID=86259 RepID=A0A4Z1NQZ2_9PEZI|nr:methionyl-tRNA formyltransferase family protein [Venturia nashicola]